MAPQSCSILGKRKEFSRNFYFFGRRRYFASDLKGSGRRFWAEAAGLLAYTASDDWSALKGGWLNFAD
jgi:hypothetical protein